MTQELSRRELCTRLIAGGLLGAMPLALSVVAVGSVATSVQRIIIAYRRLSSESPSAESKETAP